LKHIIFATTFVLALLEPANAQTRPSEQTNELVRNVTEAFFDLPPQDSFDIERAFMSDSFASAMTQKSWQNVREKLIEAAGKTTRYVAHNLTYYQRDFLIAAVDFSGQATKPDMFICGYILWEISDPNTIGFVRLEQNVVPVSVFQSMPIQEAAQLMGDWRCPVSLIETVLR
jgi:hypothetical protein